MKKVYVIILIVLAMAGAGALIYFGHKRKQRREELYASIHQAISEDAGAEETKESEVKTKILVAKCSGYTGADADADKLIAAQGGISMGTFGFVKPDDDDAIFEVLRGKTSAQYKCIDEALKARHGIGLISYIEKVFGEYWDSSNKEKALTIINSAK